MLTVLKYQKSFLQSSLLFFFEIQICTQSGVHLRLIDPEGDVENHTPVVEIQLAFLFTVLPKLFLFTLVSSPRTLRMSTW